MRGGSVDSGPIHLVSLNCYGPTAVGSNQYEWLKKDLDKVVLQPHQPPNN